VRFFHFLNLNSNFEFEPVGNQPEPEPVGPVPTVSGPVPTGSVNPGWEGGGGGQGTGGRRRGGGKQKGGEYHIALFTFSLIF
jgi:hypothetical protein